MHVVSRYRHHHDIRVEMNLMIISNAILQPEDINLEKEKFLIPFVNLVNLVPSCFAQNLKDFNGSLF